MTDDLTGLHNLRSFEACLPALIQQSRAQGSSLSMLVFDVDRLKSLNDQHGHLAGAEAVRTVGHLVAARLPEDAVASRYGGDEFVVAIPSCPPFRARQIANDLCRTVSDTAPVLAGIAFPTGTISISVGIATCVFDLEKQTRTRTAMRISAARSSARLTPRLIARRNRVGIRSAEPEAQTAEK